MTTVVLSIAVVVLWLLGIAPAQVTLAIGAANRTIRRENGHWKAIRIAAYVWPLAFIVGHVATLVKRARERGAS